MNVYVNQGTTEVFKFPAGEVGVKYVDPSYTKICNDGEISIVARIQNSDDVMTVLMLNDALHREGHTNIDLDMPYIPYSRQDRVCNPGEALSIKVFADLINSCNFRNVYVIDPHSDVAPALINNVVITPQENIFSRVIHDWKNVVVIAPDGGALKKAERFAKKVEAKSVVAANKKRDVLTGNIEYVKLTESVDGEHVFVIDDIGEGCGTFLMLADQLQGVKSKCLAITHGIFSKGLNVLDAYDKVYTTNSYHPDLGSQGNLTVFKV